MISLDLILLYCEVYLPHIFVKSMCIVFLMLLLTLSMELLLCITVGPVQLGVKVTAVSAMAICVA